MIEKENSDKKTRLICVTNRHLCEGGLTGRLRLIARAGKESAESGGPVLDGIILREKDLSVSEYDALAEEAKAVCEEFGIRFIRHFYPPAAGIAEGSGGSLHMPLEKLAYCVKDGSIDPAAFDRLGASCHSAEDAKLAESLGCTYVSFGHVFETDCKKGLAPRGLSMLEEVSRSVDIPVYAIGGISPSNFGEALGFGAAGVCIMSGFMKCADPAEYLRSFNL